MKFTILLLLTGSCAAHVGKLRASTPVQLDVNATLVNATAANKTVTAAVTAQPLQPDVNATVENATVENKTVTAVVTATVANKTVATVAQVRKVPEERGDKAEEGQMPQGVTMQIPENEIDDFLGKLSADCNKQYSKMFSGEGSGLHTFGSQGTEPTAEACSNLNGSLCATTAHVAQELTNSSGREMRTTVNVKGKGCLPQACISKDDLSVLAAFFHSKAKNSGKIAGQGVDLDLHVDCTESGGSIAASPGSAPKEKHEEATPSEEKHDEHEEHDEHAKDDKHEDSEHDHHDVKSSACSFGAVAIVHSICLFQLFA